MDARSGTIGIGRADVRLSRAQWLAVLVPGALLAGALGSQHLGGLHPCEMCFWQRYPHWAALALGGLSFFLPRARRPLVLLAAGAIAISGAIGVFHAGVELGWWEGLTHCSATGAVTLEDILATPLIRCDQVQFAFLGLSMAAWNALISLSAAGAIAWLTLRRR
uniref:disulfide bond formation protein B n=1 Tax=uncultured Sphingomonas sp. TaxID=158754 RepID=UPI0025D7FA09|nr:disulfide bond formation protein B [uncultured Sphingomonas sp.]